MKLKLLRVWFSAPLYDDAPVNDASLRLIFWGFFFSFQFHQQLLRHFEAGFCSLVQQKNKKNNLIFKICGEKRDFWSEGTKNWTAAKRLCSDIFLRKKERKHIFSKKRRIFHELRHYQVCCWNLKWFCINNTVLNFVSTNIN